MRFCRSYRFFLFLILILPNALQAEQVLNSQVDKAPSFSNYHRGPLELSDQFPLGLYHLSFLPSSPETLPAKSVELRGSFAWTNTHNRIAGALDIDSEIRSLELSANYGVSDSLELGLQVPILWQGGGVLDSFIENWHRTFGLPQGPRDDPGVLNDSLSLEYRNDENQISSLESQGLALGDARVSSKYQLSKGDRELPALAFTVDLRVPSGSSRFGGDSLDIGLGVHASKGFGSIYVYSGLGYQFFEDTKREELEFERHRAQGYVYLEWAIAEKVSLLLGASLASDLIANISRFPDYQMYLDIGGYIELSPSAELELLVRENPTPDTGTADYTMMLGLRHQFSLL